MPQQKNEWKFQIVIGVRHDLEHSVNLIVAGHNYAFDTRRVFSLSTWSNST
jgi:hypothetical protein